MRMHGYATMDADDGNYMVINGMRYSVINSWVESEGGGRKRWGIVTEGEMPDAETGRQPHGARASVNLVPMEECPGGDLCEGRHVKTAPDQ